MKSRLYHELKLVRLPFWLGIGLGLLNGLLIIGWAYALTQVIDRVFLQDSSLAEVQNWLFLMGGIAMLRFGTLWGSEIAFQQVAGTIKTFLRERLFAHLLRLGPHFASGERSGELVNTLTEGIEALDTYFRQYLPQRVLVLVVPFAILLVVFPQDTLSGMVLLLTAPLLPVFIALIGMWSGAVSRRQFESMSYLSAHFLDVMQGLTTLKLLNRSRSQIKMIARLSDDFRVATMQVLRIAFLSALVLELLTTLSIAIIAVEIGLRLLYDRITFEQAFFVLVLAPEFYQPIRNFGASFHASTKGLSAARRIFEILDTPTVEVSQDTRPIPEKIRVLNFESVSFTYPQRDTPALDRLTFQIEAGQSVAIMGESGAGKSTLAALLLRFIEPSTGQITLNGVALQQFSLSAWRQQIAWVSQHPYLFNTTLLDNLRMAKPTASMDELFWAAEQADLLTFIQKLPQQWETRIGERGTRLSGGQAQRLAIARAFLKDAPLLLWDEATAHLDNLTETRVLQAWEKLRTHRTSLLITHRARMTEHIDRTLRLHQGRIVQ